MWKYWCVSLDVFVLRNSKTDIYLVTFYWVKAIFVLKTQVSINPLIMHSVCVCVCVCVCAYAIWCGFVSVIFMSLLIWTIDRHEDGQAISLHFHPLNRNEAKISQMPSCVSDVIWSHSLCSSDQVVRPRYQVPSLTPPLLNCKERLSCDSWCLSPFL